MMHEYFGSDGWHSYGHHAGMWIWAVSIFAALIAAALLISKSNSKSGKK